MTRKRFIKLLMGRHKFTRTEAFDAASMVTIKERPMDGKDLYYHIPNRSYAWAFKQLDKDMVDLVSLILKGEQK